MARKMKPFSKDAHVRLRVCEKEKAKATGLQECLRSGSPVDLSRRSYCAGMSQKVSTEDDANAEDGASHYSGNLRGTSSVIA